MNQSEKSQDLIQRIITCLKKNGGENYITSVILTGSFGRGEETYVSDPSGNLVLKSDVEIALIFPFKWKQEVLSLSNKISAEFNEDLNFLLISENRMRHVCNFNYSLIVPKHKSLFTYDLYNGSKVIYGEDLISDKEITLDVVDPYEAKRIVANRIGEMIFLQNSKNVDIHFLHVQWSGKLILAIGTAWLILNGMYSPSFNDQAQLLERQKNQVNKDLGENFISDYQKVVQFLRKSGTQYIVPEHLQREYLKKIDVIFKSRGLNNSKINTMSRNIKYLSKYFKTGMKYGIIGFEDNILQSLIDDYISDSNDIISVSNAWHNVLY